MVMLLKNCATSTFSINKLKSKATATKQSQRLERAYLLKNKVPNVPFSRKLITNTKLAQMFVDIPGFSDITKHIKSRDTHLPKKQQHLLRS